MFVAKFKLRRKEVKREKCLFHRADPLLVLYQPKWPGDAQQGYKLGRAVGIARSFKPRIFCVHMVCFKIFHARHGVLTYLHVHEGLGHLHELIGAATQAGHGATGVAR